MTRPALHPAMAPAAFAARYSLKTELVAFCKACGLPSTGSKTQLENRILAFLQGQPLPAFEAPVKSGQWPSRLTLETPIPPQAPCSQALRKFMEEQVPGFHFDGHMRAFFKQNPGRTLQDAVQHWQDTRGERLEIGKQFQYNQHMRDHRQAHPEASREEAIAAWWEKIGGRRA